MGMYIRASALEGLDDIGEKHGQDILPLLEEYGFSSGIFRAKETEVEFLQAIALLEECAARWNIPDLGVQRSRYFALESLGVISLAVRMESTVRAATNAIIRNMFIHTNGASVSLIEHPQSNLAEFVFDVRTEGTPCRQFREATLCNSRITLQCLAEHPVKLISASVPHEAPVSRLDSLSRELGVRVAYGAERCAFEFEKSVLDQKIKKTDVAFHPIIRRYFAEVTAEHRNNFPEAVRLEVMRQLSLGVVSQDKVAASLQMQPRSLQRRLKQFGVSFREILDTERRRKSLSLVQQTNLPFAELALAVGYSDQTAFNQAFRRWFGRSPLKVRKGQGLIAAA